MVFLYGLQVPSADIVGYGLRLVDEMYQLYQPLRLCYTGALQRAGVSRQVILATVMLAAKR